jgi:hypothetical protein
MSLRKLLRELPQGPRKGAQAAEDPKIGTLETWINRRRGGTALASMTRTIRHKQISDVIIL